MICLHFDTNGHQCGFLIKGLDLGNKNTLFIVDFCVCLNFVKINNNLVTFRKNAKRSSIWLSNERSGDLT
jgi:hypothetical protein